MSSNNNKLLEILKKDPTFYSSVKKCRKTIIPILNRFLINFPDFTDHSIDHSESVLDYTDFLLRDVITDLNIDEIYILIMACYLHDIGMCPTDKMLNKINKSKDYIKYIKKGKKRDYKSYIREIHHILTYDYIMNLWNKIDIPNEHYAKAIATVAKGHRKEDLFDFEDFNPKFRVKSGIDYVCLPFLAGVLRLSDELQITNDRMPDLLFSEYLPKDKISKKEWEKQKSNYLVNFEEDKIIITSKCNKHIYNSMVRNYEKIKNTLLDVKKTFKYLALGDRNLDIRYKEIISNIEADGFIAKNIGFNLDLDNTLETIIGNRLYRNKYVAIREALQNSIDTCRYRKKLESSFNPRIEITIYKNNKLIINDNGLGMDDFIIENYFAKLGGSFYKQKRVKNDFESISEFGIGIFSYFLLCDYFEVETKMNNKPALKFHVSKEADANFYFYNKSNRNESGTKITLFLKEPITIKELEDCVRNYIRFVEFPINIIHEKTTKIITKRTFDIDRASNLKKLIRISRIEELNTTFILSVTIENDNYSGNCGILLGRDDSNYLIPRSFYRIIHENKIKVSLSHKGIFVNDFYRNQIIRELIGEININKKKNLNLSRTILMDFENTNKIISDFSVKILEKLFYSWKKLPNKRKAFLTRQFMNNCLGPNCINNELLNSYLKFFTIEIYDGSKINYVSLSRFIMNNSKFVVFVCREPYSNNYIKKIFEDIKIPILLHFPYMNNDFYLKIFNKLGKKITVHSTKKRSYYIIHSHKKMTKKTFLYHYPNFALLEMNNNWIATYHDSILDYPLNISHNIVKYVLKNEKTIKNNIELSDLWEQFFCELHDLLFFNDSPYIEFFNRMNKILKIINKKMKTNFIVLKKDLPPWVL